MLESVLAGVLNRFLSQYVDNLSTRDLNVGIWSGDIKLRNLRLKKEALDKFRLPIDVTEGYLGDLTLSIPWSNLKGKPVRVLIENVYLLAVPTDASKSTPDEDEARAQAAKQEKLETADMLATQPGGSMSSEDEAKNESFTASLITKIVDNLQIEVRNIHIRYEDNLSVPGHPFSAGITLSGFSAVSTDEDWQPSFITNSSNGIHKLAKLESLAVYFDTDSDSLAGYSIEEAITKFTELIAREDHTPDHQFVLKPVSGEGRLVMNHKVDSTTPKTDAELLFKELGFVLDADQYRDVLSMVDLFHFYIRQREYRTFRPSQAQIEQNKSKALWRFATEAIRSEVHEKNRKWSWAYFAERRDDRKDYVRLFKAKHRKEISLDDSAYLVDLERKLAYRDIRFYRSIARSEMRKERAAAKQDEEESKPAAAAGGGWLGWVGWGAQSAAAVDVAEEDSHGMNDEQRKELYRAIDWDERGSVAAAVDVPKDFMQLRVKTKLETGSFALRTDPHGKNQDLVSLNFDGFALDIIQRTDNFEAVLALGGLRVFDGTCEGSVHPQIVRVKKSLEDQDAKIVEIAPEDREADEDDGTEVATAELPPPFFSLTFEHNPLDGRADNALAVRLRPMEIVYSRVYVEAIVRFFKPPESQLESVGALIDVASVTLEGIRKETRAGLEYALTQHKTIDLLLDLNAPIIIIPEDLTLKNCSHVVLDAGHISVESKLADKGVINEIKAKEKQEYQDEDYKRLEDLMYDKYYVRLESAQLLMGPGLQVCLDALDDDDGSHSSGSEYHILERTSLTFLAQNCILAQAPNLTRFKVSGSLPALQVNISDRKYKSMMKIIDIAIPRFDDAPPDRVPVQARKPVAYHPEDEEYHLGHDHDHSHLQDDDDAGGKDEFFDTEDIIDGIGNAHQKTFEFIFSVDRIQASIFRSNVDPTQADRLLANAILEGFRFDFGLRPYDMSVDILLRSLYVEDKMVDVQSEFRHLVTSNKLDGIGSEQGLDLVRIRYQGVQKISPEFMTLHDGIDKTVDVELSTINVIVTRGSILTLFDWVMTTFTEGDVPTPHSDESPLEDQPPLIEQSNDKLRVKVKLTSIVAVLNEDGFRLGTLSLSAADVSVMLRSPTMRVAARLGNLSFVDDFTSDGPKEMLSIQGDDLADFQYETYDPNERSTYPGHDSLVYLRTGSLQLTFVEEPVQRILTFFSKFARMKALYDAATAAAAQRATAIQTTVSKMHYDILIRTPIVRFPHQVDSHNLIVANLGEISLSNSFEVSEQRVVTKIKAGLRAICLTSILHEKSLPYSLQIIDDVDIGVDVTSTQEMDSSANSAIPATQIAATMSDVKMNLTQAQYGLLISLSRTIPRAFASSEVAEDDDDEERMTSPEPSPVSIAEEDQEQSLQAVDLLPELSNLAIRSDGVEVVLGSSLELVFSVGTIYLEIFTATAIDSDTLRDSSLARFSLNETGVKYRMLSNGSMEAEVVVRSFTVHDTRTLRQTKFREIIPATSHGGHQFMINYNQSGDSSFANVTIDSPKVIFSLDPVFALLDYFMSAFPSVPATLESDAEKEDEENDAEMDNTVVAAGTRSFAYRVNIVSPTIILLDDQEKVDSEAVVLSISQIQMTQQTTLALVVSKVGMFLCKMDKPKDTIRFLDTFDIALSLDNRTDAGRSVTNINVNTQPLVLRVSFRDIILIKNIINRAIEMSNRSAPSPPPPSALQTASPSRPVLAARKSSQHQSTTKGVHARRRSSAGLLAARIIMTKETLTATVDGFQLILIGDTHDLPLIDVKAGQFSAVVKDWSTNMSSHVTLMPFINFFNLKVSHWEPLIDPWEFDIRVSRYVATGLLSINLSSRKRLELNISSTFIELAMTTLSLLGKEAEQGFSHARGTNAPFLIKNRTGYPISLWSDDSEDAPQPATSRLDDGADVPWRFEDWRKMRETILASSSDDQSAAHRKPFQAKSPALVVVFDGMTWDRLKHVSVEREGQQVYALRPKLNNVTHRLLCEVKLIDNVKVVTFRSTFQVENRTLVVAEMVVVDGNGKRASPIYKIPPGEDYSVPILAAYESRIRLRPDPGFGHGWSSESYGWQDLVKRPTRTITCKSPKEEAFRFQAYAIHDKSDPLLRIYPRLTLRLRAPLEVQNLLPFDIRIRVYDKHIEHNWKTFLRRGGVIPMNIAELSHLLLLSVEVQDTAFGWSDFAIINTDNYEDMEVEQDLMLQDKSGVKLNLRLHYQRQENSGGAFRVQIYAPYIVINKTGSVFALKTQSFMSSAKLAAGLEDETRDGVKLAQIQPPFMFSFSKDDRKNKVQLRIKDSAWSNSLSLETVGVESEVVMDSTAGDHEIRVGLKVTEGLGDYKLTKVVTLYPRFIIKNDTEDDIRFREYGSKNAVTIHAEQRHSIEFLRAGKEPQLLLSYAVGTSDWSAPFKLQDVGESYIRMRRVNGQEALLQVSVMLEGPCIFVRLATHHGSWPYLLRNDSDYSMLVSQADAFDPLGSPQSHTKVYTLDPQSKMSYAWDLPASTNKQLKITIGERDRLVNVLEIGSQIPFRFKIASKVHSLSIDVRAEGPTQAIRFSNYTEAHSVFKLQQPMREREGDSVSRAQSVTTTSSKEGVFEAIDVDVVTTFSFGIDFEGIGISIVTQKMQELVYISFRGLSATYTDSTTSVAYDLGVKWIQIDNQLFNSLYPILLYPSVIPTDGKDLEVHPSLQASIVVLKDEAHGVTYFKYASILIQQMTIEVDEDFLFVFLEFIKSSTSLEEQVSQLTDEPDGIPEPQASAGGGDVYFEVLHLQPIQLDLSFMRTDRVNVEQKLDTRNPFFFFINSLTMALGNVNDAPVRLNALLLENVRVSFPVLQERLTLHYRQEFFRQLYRVLLSADILGTPVALFTNVSSGVRDFFVEPYDSVMMNGSKDLGIGIARGAGSLAKKTVFGLTNSMSKFTGSLGKGLSAVTLDKQYQNQRRMRQVRNRPKHALYGVSAGATSLLTSVASGFEGVVTKPLEGAESGGAVGFFKGVGKGLVGAVTKPVVGVFDFASTLTEGIRNTTTVLDDTSLDRVRLPRFTAADGILRPYQEREAVGQNWLKNLETGKYAVGETYCAHLDIPSSGDTLVALLTSKRILLVKVLTLKVGWDVPLSDLQTISLEPTGITLVLRQGVQGPFIAVPDQSSRLWFFRCIDRVVTSYNSRRVDL